MASPTTVLEVKILSLLGWVDGKFDESEHDASRSLLQGTIQEKELQEELQRMGSSLPVRSQVLADVRAAPPEVSRAAIKSGFALARADGYLHDGEFAILLELSAAAGLPQAELDRISALPNLHQAFIELERLY